MNDCIFTVDLGTSGPKAALISLEGEVLGWSFADTRLILLPEGGVEQDANEWWQKICEASKALLTRRDIPPYRVLAVAMTAQWSCVVPTDRNARPVAHAISWMDTRGASALKKIFSGLVQYQGYDVVKLGQWLRLTNGLPGPSGKDALAHILFIQEQQPHIYQQTYKFLDAKDYLNARMTGRFAATRDSITLYWLTDNRDAHRIYYHPYLLKTTGLNAEKLPELVAPASVLGELLPKAAAELGLPAGIPVVTGTPDLHSAALGSGGIADYDGHLYLGTSSWLSCHMPIRKVAPAINMATIPSALPGKYIVGNAQESAGYCLKHFAEQLLFPQNEPEAPAMPTDLYPWLNRLAESVPPTANRVIYTPWLFGERTPVENKTIRGGFHNISGATHRAHLTRAVFEGVAYNSRWLMESVEKFTGQQFRFLRIIGGGALSDLWCQIHADILNREIRRVAEPRLANLKGAALLAGLSIGRLSPQQMSERIKMERSFEPNSQYRAAYDELYAEFRNLYNVEKKIYARLNRKES